MRGKNMKLKTQLTFLFMVIFAFILFNYGIYSNFTVRYIDMSGDLMKEKSLDIDQYLPFDESSKIIQQKAHFQLSGDLPVLDGATALLPLYSAFMNATYPSGSSEFDRHDFSSSSYLHKRGTSGAYKAIIDGTADIIFVASPSEQQKQYAESAGKHLIYVPIGYEAFVFIVNAKNTVDSLTVEQIRGIYSGTYTNWQQLGGKNAAINALQRVENSGSQTAMISFMENTPLRKRVASLFGQSIGYSFRYYVSDLSGKDNVKMLALNNVYPTEENIRNETYPITDCFYAVYSADNPNENVNLLLDWILSEQGQNIVNETGYVNLSKTQ